MVILEHSKMASNYMVLPVVLRMYYILSVLDERIIHNIEFKRELLKIIIKELLNKIDTMEELENRDNNLHNFLPFIKFDY